MKKRYLAADSSGQSLGSTTIGSEQNHTQSRQLLPRDHNLSKEQLIGKMRKEMQCVMDYIAQTHDKLGNGFSAYLYTFKRINA